MLRTPSFNKKKKPTKESYFQEGITLIKGNLYKQATKEFYKALQEDAETISPALFNEFNTSIKNSQFEAAIAIGEALEDLLNQKSSFLVSMGNCYRRLSNYQKANDFYRKALRVDKSNKLAFYNLGASLAKVNKFDLEIKKALDQFKDQNNHILPPYLNDPDIVDKITEELEKERKERHSIIDSLQAEKKRKQKENDTETVKEIVKKIEKEERQLAVPPYQAICKKLRKAIRTNWARQTIEETKASLQQNLFNLGLYALSQNDLSLARESFLKLKSENSTIENLDLLLALTIDLDGKSNLAIEKLIAILKQSPNDRFATVNLGLLYRKRGNLLLSIRYLAKAADMLEQSGGLYCLTEIEIRANEYFADENYTEALKLFSIVVKEAPNTSAWNRIGEIHLQKEELVEAIMAFHEALELEPDCQQTHQKLLQVHDIYVLKADTQFRNGYNLDAITFYQNALEIHKSVEVISKAIKAHEKVSDFPRVNSLKSEIERLKESEKEANLEKKRLELVKQGKILMKQKKFNSAIEHLEKAFDIKPDKDTFLLLAHILKALNQSRKLANLVQQWRNLMEREGKES